MIEAGWLGSVYEFNGAIFFLLFLNDYFLKKTFPPYDFANFETLIPNS